MATNIPIRPHIRLQVEVDAAQEDIIHVQKPIPISPALIYDTIKLRALIRTNLNTITLSRIFTGAHAPQKTLEE